MSLSRYNSHSVTVETINIFQPDETLIYAMATFEAIRPPSLRLIRWLNGLNIAPKLMPLLELGIKTGTLYFLEIEFFPGRASNIGLLK